MLKITKNVNLNGMSQVDVDGTSKTIGYFTANLSESGSVNTSANISDRSLYEAHKAAYRSDRAEFDAYVDDMLDANEMEEQS